jgi:hypothetical protein
MEAMNACIIPGHTFGACSGSVVHATELSCRFVDLERRHAHEPLGLPQILSFKVRKNGSCEMFTGCWAAEKEKIINPHQHKCVPIRGRESEVS